MMPATVHEALRPLAGMPAPESHVIHMHVGQAGAHIPTCTLAEAAAYHCGRFQSGCQLLRSGRRPDCPWQRWF